MKKRHVALVLAATMMLSLAGCAGSNEKTEDTKKAQTETKNKTEGKEDAVQIDGALSIYCGAGMQQPFQEIADAFQEETGCEMQHRSRHRFGNPRKEISLSPDPKKN